MWSDLWYLLGIVCELVLYTIGAVLGILGHYDNACFLLLMSLVLQVQRIRKELKED